MIEQARASRERAEFYRQLALKLGRNRAADTFEKSARELEERAEEMEKYAIWFTGPGEDAHSLDEANEGRDSEFSDGNVVGRLQRAIERALTTPKKPG